MGIKIEVGGKPVASMSNADLSKLAEQKGKKSHKARIELEKRSYDFSKLVEAKA